MKITITGALGNIGRQLSGNLVSKGHHVTVVSRDAGKETAIRQIGAIPAIGSVEDPAFLHRAFAKADAVFTMTPPNYHSTDIRAYMRATGENYARAIRHAGIRYVVNLSSIGADLPDGPGPAGANHYIEEQLNESAQHVLHLRPGMFYTNFLGAIDMIRHQHILGNNFDGDTKMVLSHPRDIADIASEALNKRDFAGSGFRYIAGDEKSGNEIVAALGRAIGQPDLSWVAFPDDAMLQGMISNGLSEQMASVYIIAIGKAIRENTLFDHYYRNKQFALGKTSLADFAREFAAIYQAAV